jgi:hypothetical protein
VPALFKSSVDQRVDILIMTITYMNWLDTVDPSAHMPLIRHASSNEIECDYENCSEGNDSIGFSPHAIFRSLFIIG